MNFTPTPAAPTFRRMLDLIHRLLFATDTTLLEFVSSTTMLLLGAILTMPEESLISGAGLFVLMKGLMPEGAWGVLFLAVGLFQAFANLTSGKKMRRLAAFTAAAVFSFVGFLGARVVPISLFGAMCKVHAVGQVLAGLHLGVRGGK